MFCNPGFTVEPSLLVVFPADHWSPSFAIGRFWASLFISEHLLRLTSIKYVESIVISAAPSHFTPHQSQQSWLLQPTSLLRFLCSLPLSSNFKFCHNLQDQFNSHLFQIVSLVKLYGIIPCRMQVAGLLRSSVRSTQ